MIFLDAETTGLMKPDAAELNLQPFLTELYVAKFTDDLEFISEFDSMFKPMVPISEEIERITGITNEMVANAPKFIEQYDQLCDFFLGETVAVGHNVSFDLGVIWAELARHRLEYKFPWPKTWICTVEKSMSIEHRRMKLSSLYELATGHPHVNAHRARGDVEATFVCYKYLKEIGLIT